MTDRKTGRPPLYTEAQIHTGMDIVEDSGAIPDGESVKTAMVRHCAVSDGINVQCLDKEVARLRTERARRRTERLVHALPEPIRLALAEIGAQLTQSIIAQVAQSNDDLRRAADERVVERDQDLATQRDQLMELRIRLGARDASIVGLEAQNAKQSERIGEALAEIADLKIRIADLQCQDDFRKQMLEVMRETLGDRVQSAA